MVAELTFTERQRVMPLFAGSTRLHCVYLALLARQEGKLFTDDAAAPKVAIFIHPFFAVAAGDCKNPEAEKLLKHVPKNTIILPLDSAWNPVIKSVFGKRIIPMPRTKFVEQIPDLARARELAASAAQGYRVEPISQDNVGRLLETFKDTREISGLFWTAETFVKESFGSVAVDKDGNIVSVSIMGTPLHNKKFEIHTETHPDHRRKGLATAVNASVVVESGRRGLIPLWDAANENSVNLAKKVGFTEESRYEIFFVMGWGLYMLKATKVLALIKWMARGRKRA